jgi:DNA-binding transcriptional MerR regulator
MPMVWPVPTVPDLITTEATAATLGVNPSTVSRWARAGVLRSVAKGEGSRGPRFFNRADVEALRTERIATMTAELAELTGAQS